MLTHLFLCLSITGGSSCVTDSGPDNGSPCIFPFTLDGATYNECAEFSDIDDDDYDDYYNYNDKNGKWCSTEVPCIVQVQPFLHHQEEILRFPKHPQKSSFWWVLAEKTAKNKVAPKIEYQKYFRKNLSSLEHHILASDSSNWASRECFGIVKTSSWRWAQIFFKLMHPGLSNNLKTILINYCANCNI